MLKPVQCPPTAVDVLLEVDLDKPQVQLNTLLDFLVCPKSAPKGTCTDITASGLLISAINGQLITTTFPIILKKFVAAAVDALSVNVEKVTKLAFTLPTAGPLISALGQKLLGYTTDEINKKGLLYTEMIKVVNDLGKTLLNQLLSEELAPKFGKNCYK